VYSYTTTLLYQR